MPQFQHRSRQSVSELGAAAGSILRGSGLGNQGLRLRVQESQAKGHDGPVRGRLVILDAGDNMHSRVLDALVDRPTDAAEVVGIVRRDRPGCVSPVNANILAVEEA